MIEVRDPSSGAILFKKSSSEKKVEALEKEVAEMRELLGVALDKLHETGQVALIKEQN